MVLTGPEIVNQIENKNIKITDFDIKRVNPNSYNLRLHDRMLVYTQQILDMKKINQTKEIIIPPEGFILQPGELYLGRTMEHTETMGFLPIVEGRSSIGRLGIFVHVTAGFGDNGFKGYWTLEITCIKPVRIYSEVEIVQIYYNTLQGEQIFYNNGKYQNNNEVQSSMLYKDFINKPNVVPIGSILSVEYYNLCQEKINPEIQEMWKSGSMIRIHQK